MSLFLISLAAFAVAMLGMALGVLLGRRPITGSCGRDCRCFPAADDADER